MAKQLTTFFEGIGIGYNMFEETKREVMRKLYTFQKRQKDIESFFKASGINVAQVA